MSNLDLPPPQETSADDPQYRNWVYRLWENVNDLIDSSTTSTETSLTGISVFDFFTANQILDVQSNVASIDVTIAVQKAVDTYRQVYFPAGTYLISSVNLRSGSLITGDGERTILKQYGRTTTLNGGISAVALSIVVTNASLFPVAYPYYLIIQTVPTAYEIVQVTAGAGNTLTVVRAQLGTVAAIWATLASVSYIFGFPILRADSGSAVVANNLTGIAVRDLQLRGLCDTLGFSEFVHLLEFSGVTDGLIENVTFRGFQGDGCYIASSLTAAVERHNINITVRSCVFDGINKENRNGISIIDGDGILIDDCDFTNCTKGNMPGAIDFEPDANAFAVIKNAIVRDCRFSGIGGNLGVVSVVVPVTVTAAPTNISILDNSANGCDRHFFAWITSRAPTSTSAENNLLIAGNSVVGGAPFQIYDGKRVTLRDNSFTNCVGNGLLGFTAAENKARDVEITNNRFVRCASAGTGIGLDIYKVDHLLLQDNKFIDCGTGGAGTANAIDFNTGASSYVSIIGNEISSPTGKTLVAIQKEAGHSFSTTTNKYYRNELNGLANSFVSQEADALEQSYSPIVVGSIIAGGGSYPTQVGWYRRVGKTVFYRVELAVSAGHTGTGRIHVSLPMDVKVSNGERRAAALIADGVATTGGHTALIDPGFTVGGVAGVIQCFATATGIATNIIIPAGAFAVFSSGSYEAT